MCVHLKAQGEHEPYFIGRRIFTLRYFIHWTIHGMNISSTLFGYITVSFFLPLYFYSCGYKCNMNPATNAKPNNGTLKILIASLPTHSYEHTHTQKPKTVIKQQSNNAYKLFITWHEFKPSFCLLLLLTAVHVVSPCSFCFFILCFIPAT